MPNPVKEYYDSGNLKSETWYKNGKYHRINAPAFIWYSDTGYISSEAWVENDKMHRIDGPAYEDLDEDGNLLNELWYHNGIRLTDKEVTVLKRKLKLCQIQ